MTPSALAGCGEEWSPRLPAGSGFTPMAVVCVLQVLGSRFFNSRHTGTQFLQTEQGREHFTQSFHFTDSKKETQESWESCQATDVCLLLPDQPTLLCDGPAREAATQVHVLHSQPWCSGRPVLSSEQAGRETAIHRTPEAQAAELGSISKEGLEHIFNI